MKKYAVTLVILLMAAGCPSPTIFRESAAPKTAQEHKDKVLLKEPGPQLTTFEEHLTVRIPLLLPDGPGELNADVYRPHKKSQPTTLVIIVPGSGNVSRRGETAGDGVDAYDTAINLSVLWAQSLVEHGYFVLSYDKRTCIKKLNSYCLNNSQKDIETLGIGALANDLDQVYRYSKAKLDLGESETRLILLSSTQGAQVVSSSQSLRLASGVVLFSPILGRLDEMWVGGLSRAAEQRHNFAGKNRLINQAESTRDFFSSLKANKFPEQAVIRGASVQFWQSWMKASLETVDRLSRSNRPVLTIFSAKDSFSSAAKISNNQAISKKITQQADRNMVDKGQADPQVINDVISFIDSCSKTMPLSKLSLVPRLRVKNL